MTKCKLCDRKAVVRLEYANMSLCREHFLEYFKRRVRKTLEKYRMVGRGERVMAAVSGGKDSGVMLDVLARISRDAGFTLEALYIDLGIPGYSSDCLSVVRELCERLGVPLRVLDLKEYAGFTVADLMGTVRRVCSACGVVKRYVLNRYAWEEGFDKVATGHTLDDATQNILRGIINGDLETLLRIAPYSPPRGKLVGRIRPLIEMPEKDILIYALLRGVPFTTAECPNAREAKGYALRRALDLVELESPSSKKALLTNFLERIQPLLRGAQERELRECSVCSMPSSAEVCSFCRLRSRILVRVGAVGG